MSEIDLEGWLFRRQRDGVPPMDPYRWRVRVRWLGRPWAWWRRRDDYPGQGCALKYRIGPFLLIVLVG